MLDTLKSLIRFVNPNRSKYAIIRTGIERITNLVPNNITLYAQALQYSAAQGYLYSNERLEFLGDAVLSSVTADYLFKRYPLQNEGFLTEIRSRVVNRESLGLLSKKLGIDSLLCRSGGRRNSRFVNGNTLEALVGAIYLDKGYEACCQFIIEKILGIHIDFEELVNCDNNYKSQVIHLATANHKHINFVITDVERSGNHRKFTVQVLCDGKLLGEGQGITKKHAEQEASMVALNHLESIDL